MANFSLGKDQDRPPLQPADFFATLAEAKPREMTGDEMLLAIQAFRASRGTVN